MSRGYREEIWGILGMGLYWGIGVILGVYGGVRAVLGYTDTSGMCAGAPGVLGALRVCGGLRGVHGTG